MNNDSQAVKGSYVNDDSYEMMCGLEVHVELSTKTKLFCRCSTKFGDPPNTNICPICLGLPGALPKLNQEAVRLAVRAALALNCRVNLSSRFDRKNYFYPDLPKGYQISQFEEPLALEGYIEIDNPRKKIRIRRLHMEEDAGKSLHAGDEIVTAEYSLLDFNRCGVPLIEIVSEPDMASPDEARQYLEKLQRVLAFAEVSDVKMEEGSMRVDCNISVMPKGSHAPGVPCELKNLSSFKAVVRALSYEFQRQKELLSSGQKVIRETRHWDEKEEKTFSLRTKETSEDYRYFPDPDLRRLELDEDFIEEIRATMPKSPEEIMKHYINDLGLSGYDAGILTSSPAMSRYFDECLALGAEPKACANWVMGDLLGYMNTKGIPYDKIPISPEYLVSLLKLISQGVISGKIGKEVLVKSIETGKSPDSIVKEEGLEQISDDESLERIVEKVISDNPDIAKEIRAGKDKAIGFLVGQVMKLTRGKANPSKVNIMLKNKLL